MWSYQRVPAGEGMKGDIELVWQQEGVCVCERERQSSGKSCGKCECVCARAPLWARMRFIQRDFCLEAGWWSKCRCEDGRYRTWKWRPALVVHCNATPPPCPSPRDTLFCYCFPPFLSLDVLLLFAEPLPVFWFRDPHQNTGTLETLNTEIESRAPPLWCESAKVTELTGLWERFN